MSRLDRLEKLLESRANKCSVWEFEHKIRIDGNNVYADLECMYYFENFISFDFLSEISELFGTKKINTTREEYSPGCDTCDYGSCSEMTIEILGCSKEGDQ